MTDFLIGVVLWILGGYVGARIAALLNRGNRLGFWGQIAAGMLGGIILGLVLDNIPLLEPVTRFFHNGNIEDAIAGLLGGAAFGTLGQLFAARKTGATRNGGASGPGSDGSGPVWPAAGSRRGHDKDGSAPDDGGGSGGGGDGGGD